MLHRCLVDMSAALKLDDSVGVSRGGLGVSEWAPPVCRLDLQLNQRGPLLFGTRGYRAVLCHQLATAAPGKATLLNVKACSCCGIDMFICSKVTHQDAACSVCFMYFFVRNDFTSSSGKN